MRYGIWPVWLLLLIGPALAQDAVSEPPLPQPRPENLGEPEAPAEEVEPDGEAADAAEPQGEQERVYQAACPALLSGRVVGEMAPPLAEGTCGLQSPITLQAVTVSGRQIALSGQPITNCAMATALADWAQEVDAYAQAALDTEIESLSTGPGYVCRLRNNADTGFVSEHGLGNAVDIAAINFADGTSIAVLDDYSPAPVRSEARFLGFAHSAACGRFTTVLGPEANADHADHFHFDLGCHGQTCTAQICE